MRIAISALGMDGAASTSPVFGRCPAFVFVDLYDMQFEGVANPCMASGGGAGIQAAQFVLDHGAQAVLTHYIGPHAYAVLRAAQVAVYRIDGGTVREAVAALQAGALPALEAPNTPMHRGLHYTSGAQRSLGDCIGEGTMSASYGGGSGRGAVGRGAGGGRGGGAGPGRMGG
ncbi:MAG: NifB/NifX family molybdenum-iron cluster-binding protein, partial [Anaerolineae bacterium]